MAKIEANGNMKIVRKWGKIEGEKLLTQVYNAFIRKAEPRIVLERFKNFRKLMFNFGEIIIKNLSETNANIIYRDIDPDFEVYYNILRGWMTKFLELCIDKKVSSKFIAKSWKGAPETIVNFLWSN